AESARSDSFTFRITVPEPSVRLDGGFAEISVEGLETTETRPGVPDLPTATYLVAIPAEGTPVLEVETRGTSLLRGVRPRPVPRRASFPSPDELGQLSRSDGIDVLQQDVLERTSRLLYAADPLFYEDTDSWPRAVAWLGRTGVLRNQRYVEVHVAPLRWSGSSGAVERNPDLR